MAKKVPVKIQNPPNLRPPVPTVVMPRPAPPKKFRGMKPRRSLRTILLIWFLLLSLVPLMFVTGYSLVKYEQAIDREVVERLRTNSREFEKLMNDIEKFLVARRNRHKSDPVLISYLLTGATAQTHQYVQNLVRSSTINETLNVFDADGELVASYTKDDTGNAKQNVFDNSTPRLNEKYLSSLEKSGQMTYVDPGSSNNIDLIAVSRLEGKNGRRAGYVEEIFNIGPAFLKSLNNKLGFEIILFDSKGQIVAGSHEDFALYGKGSFARTITSSGETLFDLTIRSQPYGFIANKVKFGDSEFYAGLGVSKERARTFVKNVNYAFFTMVGAICILLVFTSIFATKVIVRPVYELVEAIQSMKDKDGPAEIPVSTDTEFGVLQESFNEMSRSIFEARSDLEKKVREVEAAYRELKNTQARLVHTAKMASVGQLVAGIAHELNNPIGFIYSNMSHLKDYSDRLVRIIEAAEKNPKKIAEAKEENDFKYIVEDLPRLISSCEDGARRTRDIVLGLRNFSRLDEATVKRVSLQEGIENTLRLIAGELKNRVRVHEDFQKVPEVLCYASQLNQVFMNILTNAAQAIDGEGDIWISLSATPKQKNQPARALISIKDSGKGMAADIVDKIFDPFFTTKNVGQGTGLGLSISYGIVKQHGGDILVRSEVGKGTEFTITLPVDGPEAV